MKFEHIVIEKKCRRCICSVYGVRELLSWGGWLWRCKMSKQVGGLFISKTPADCVNVIVRVLLIEKKRRR